jgi:outer membrane protein assembly factor BamB
VYKYLYVGTANGTLHAVNATSGARIWTFHAKGSIRSSPLVLTDYGYVVFGTDEGRVYALRAASGTPRWVFPAPNSNAVDPVQKV